MQLNKKEYALEETPVFDQSVGVVPHMNCYKAEFRIIGKMNLRILKQKKFSSWKCVEYFFARHCIMRCLELDLAFDSALNRGIWYYLSDFVNGVFQKLFPWCWHELFFSFSNLLSNILAYILRWHLFREWTDDFLLKWKH